MKVLVSLAAVVGLFLLGLLGGTVVGLGWVFGVALPYLAVAVFVVGVVCRVVSWARVPVPFRIPTTCGQQKSLPWIRHAKLDNPHGLFGVFGRMTLEVLFFRSLLRNTKAELRENGTLAYGISLALWLGAMVFHWSMLIVLLRHLRLLIDPVPYCVTLLQVVDGFLLRHAGSPVLFLTSILFLAGLAYLLSRRLASPQLRYISLAGDYFPLFMLLGIGISGVWLRHLSKTDIVGVKELAMGLVSFAPTVPERAIGCLFYGHLFLVSVLLAYFPLSKLVHMAGVFLSPTRNLANNSRVVRHVNPWDYCVNVHTYEKSMRTSSGAR
jgi:nitrate reductase gamma subunit